MSASKGRPIRIRENQIWIGVVVGAELRAEVILPFPVGLEGRQD